MLTQLLGGARALQLQRCAGRDRLRRADEQPIALLHPGRDLDPLGLIIAQPDRHRDAFRLAACNPQHPRRLRIRGVHRGERHDQRAARLLGHTPFGEQAGNEPAADVGNGHEDRHLPGDRIGRGTDPLDAAAEGLAGVTADLELHRQAGFDHRQRLRRHCRLELHAARIDDVIQLGARGDDVAGVGQALRDHAVERRTDRQIGQLFPGRRDARTRILELRLGGGHGIARHVELALGQRSALDQALGARRLAFGDAERLLRRFHGGLRRLVGVAERLILDARQQRPATHVLPFRGRHLQDRSAHLRPHARVLLRRERAGDQRPGADVLHRDGDDVLLAELHRGRRGGRVWRRWIVLAGDGRCQKRRAERDGRHSPRRLTQPSA